MTADDLAEMMEQREWAEEFRLDEPTPEEKDRNRRDFGEMILGILPGAAMTAPEFHYKELTLFQACEALVDHDIRGVLSPRPDIDDMRKVVTKYLRGLPKVRRRRYCVQLGREYLARVPRELKGFGLNELDQFIDWLRGIGAEF